ncbi:MAG: CBS domain-containing protein [Halobacteriaceae archaeon]
MYLPTPQDLKARRDELDLTQAELADLADVSQPLIARIEGGDVDPRLSTLRRIIEALDEVEGRVVRARELMNEAVVSVAPDDAVSEASDLMLEEGYSQLPVLRNGSPSGIITNTEIRHAREQSDGDLGDLPVADAESNAYLTVEPDATLEQIENYLDRTSAVFVVEDERVIGIITEADVAAYLSR